MPKPESTIPPAPSATLDALRASIGVLRWALMLLVFVYIGSNVRFIRPHENALVLRFGRVMEKVYTPGLLVAFPPPIDEVIVVPTRTVQEIELDDWAPQPAAAQPAPSAKAADVHAEPAAEAAPPPPKETLHPVKDGYALTGDVNLVQVRFTVRYSISDPKDYALRAKPEGKEPRIPEGLLRRVLLDAATEAMQVMGVDDALTSGQEKLRLDCRRIAQEKIDRLKLGILLQAWEIREIVPARRVLPAFEDVVSAKVEARTVVEKSNAYRQSRMPEVQAKSFRIRQEADGVARRTVERARGEAQAFIAQWEVARNHMEAFREQRLIEAVERLMRHAWLPAISAGQGAPLQLMIRPPAHDPEPVIDE